MTLGENISNRYQRLISKLYEKLLTNAWYKKRKKKSFNRKMNSVKGNSHEKYKNGLK